LKYGNSIPPYQIEQYGDRVEKVWQVRRVAQEKKKAVVETATETSKTTEPQITFAPVRAFVDSKVCCICVTRQRSAAQNP
jgi:hypothetical protein